MSQDLCTLDCRFRAPANVSGIAYPESRLYNHYTMNGQMNLRNTPKIELHRHLEGGIRPATAWEIAKESSIHLGYASYEEFLAHAVIPAPRGGLQAVFDAQALSRVVLSSAAAIERIVFENAEDAWNDGTRLLELRFSPAVLSAISGLGFEEVIGIALAGITRAMSTFPMEIGLILSLKRKAPQKDNENVVAALLNLKKGTAPGGASGERLVGVDISDDEWAAEPEIFAYLIDKVRDAGCGVTVHTGLTTDADHVRRTLEVLKPDRIGHGIRALDDPALMDEIREKAILLEISPTSNWITDSVKSLKDHPLPQFARAGLRVCVNTDDPGLFGIDLVHEYELCEKLFGFDSNDFLAMNRNALAASFLPKESREKIERRYFS